MKLEEQVCSLDLAKRLKELGVKQSSHFKWNIAHPDKAETDSEEMALKGIMPQLVDSEWATDDGKLEDIAAFTVAELVSQLQEIEQEDIIVALSDKHVADTLAMRLCTRLQDLRESAGLGPTR